MSEFKVEVVQIGPIEKHANADTLSITHIHGGYPVIIKTGEFNEGDKAVYVPVDSVVPADDPCWEFLAGHTRIRAKRLRGVFSMGLLTAADPSWEIGQNVQEIMRITKYEPPEPLHAGGEDEADPGFMSKFTDIEGLRRWTGVFVEGEEVIITEKIHGASGRWLWSENRLWVGSHRAIKKEDPNNMYWQIAVNYKLAEILKSWPDVAIYGEVYGNVQKLKYGAKPNSPARVAFFDALDIKTHKYFDVAEFLSFMQLAGLPVVPILHHGPWQNDLASLAEGMSTIEGADHVREGIVIKPLKERWNDQVGRVVLKLPGEGYLLGKHQK